MYFEVALFERVRAPFNRADAVDFRQVGAGSDAIRQRIPLPGDHPGGLQRQLQPLLAVAQIVLALGDGSAHHAHRER